MTEWIDIILNKDDIENLSEDAIKSSDAYKVYSERLEDLKKDEEENPILYDAIGDFFEGQAKIDLFKDLQKELGNKRVEHEDVEK